MKSMKFVIGLLAAVALLSVSCEKSKEQAKKTNPYEGERMVFTLTVKNVEGDNASIQVKHNGKSKLTWYAFLSEDLDSSLEELVENNSYGLEPGELSVGANKTLSFDGLEVETDYRFVVFGASVEEDGTVWTYGTPADVTFKTSKDLNVIFSATAPVVTRNAATLSVSYDVEEDEGYTWYGFVTTDISSTTANIIKRDVKNIPADQLKSGKDVGISLEDLEFSTSYRYIVTGLLADGTVYGTPADVTFQIGEKYFLESAWTLSHSIDETTYPDYPHKFTNTVAAGSNAGKYFITLYAESVIEDTSNLPAFIEEILPDEVADLKALAEENHKTLSDYLDQGTSSDWYRLAYKKYYYFAIGLTDEGEATGAYAYATYYNEPDEAAKAEYNKWLGDWLLGADSIPVKISQNEICVNYKVDGYYPTLVPGGFLANFNASTKALDFYNQKVGETQGIEIQFNGVIHYNATTYGPISGSAYTIASAVLSADGKSADITPKSITLSDNSTVTLEGMHYYGHDDTHFYTFNAAPDPLLIPTTMVRPSETGSEAYNKWLGSWQIQRPEYTEKTDTEDGVPTGNMITDTWVIEQDFADRTYTISGIDGYDEESIKAAFDAETGGISVSEQSMGSFTQGEGDSAETYYVYLFGLFEENGSIWGGSEKIFSGVINPDGTATLTGLEFTGQTTDESTITETFTGMEIFILDSSDSIVNYGADNWGEFYSFPYTMPKLAASGSSIRMKKTGGKVNVSRSGQHLFRPFSGENHAFGYRSFTGGRKSASQYRSAEIAKAVKK